MHKFVKIVAAAGPDTVEPAAKACPAVAESPLGGRLRPSAPAAERPPSSRVLVAIRGPMTVRQPGRLQPGHPLRSQHAARRVPQVCVRCEGVCALAQ